MNEKPTQTISAVIVNHNGGREIINCLNALFDQSFFLEKIIVEDNASTDNSPSNILLKFPDVDLIKLDQNFGPSKARNIGLKSTCSDLVLLLDDDVYVHDDCIRKLHDTYKQYHPAMICPRILLHHDRTTVQCDGAEPHFIGMMKSRHAYQPVSALPSKTCEVTACISACMLVNRKAALSCGGFDESYFIYFEDLEFSLKLRSMGYSILCEPEAVVYHDSGAGTPNLSFRGNNAYPEKRVYFNIRHRLLTLLIHYRLRTLIVLAPMLLLYEVSMLAVVIRRGWLKTWHKAIVSVLKSKKHIMAKRKSMASRRVRHDRELLLGGSLPFAPGFIKNRPEQLAVNFLSAILNLYWRMTKNLIG